MNSERKNEIAEKLMHEMLTYEKNNAKSIDLKSGVTRHMKKRINQMFEEFKVGKENDIQEN